MQKFASPLSQGFVGSEVGLAWIFLFYPRRPFYQKNHGHPTASMVWDGPSQHPEGEQSASPKYPNPETNSKFAPEN